MYFTELWITWVRGRRVHPSPPLHLADILQYYLSATTFYSSPTHTREHLTQSAQHIQWFGNISSLLIIGWLRTVSVSQVWACVRARVRIRRTTIRNYEFLQDAKQPRIEELTSCIGFFFREKDIGLIMSQNGYGFKSGINTLTPSVPLSKHQKLMASFLRYRLVYFLLDRVRICSVSFSSEIEYFLIVSPAAPTCWCLDSKHHKSLPIIAL